MSKTVADKTHQPVRAKVATTSAGRRYESPEIPLSAIRRYARRVAEEFRPDKIILFGSHARGDQREGSDVDLLVVMAASNVVRQAVRIRMAVPAPFALDLIVRTPDQLRQRIADGNWFLREITESGVVLYEKRNRRVGPKSRSGLVRSAGTRRQTAPRQ